MKRYGRKIRWDRKAIFGFGTAVGLILLATQVPSFLWIWPWGPGTGYRTAGLTGGHYERRFPAILRDRPMVGQVLIGGGERLVLDYEVVVEEGKLSFSIWKRPLVANRPQYVGPRSIASGESGRIELVPEDGPGLYEIAFYAHSLQGAVSVDWRTEPALQRADGSNPGGGG